MKSQYLIITLMCMMLSVGCFGPKKTTTTKPTNGTGQTTPNNGNTGTNTKPTTGNDKPNNSGNNSNNNSNTGTDTKPTTGNDKPSNTAFKSSYNIALLLPFYTDKFSDTSALYNKSVFAMDYYAGAKLGFEAMQNESIKLNINVLDSKGSRGDYTATLQKAKNADVIIGPAEKDNITAAIKFANEQKIATISPFFPSGPLDNDCKYLYQINPSLQAHCEGITKHILARYKPSQVVLVCRGKDDEQARLKYFQDENKLNNSSNARFQELIVNDESYSLGNTPMDSYMKAGQTTVFVVPSWNEKFITSLVQKLDKMRKKDNIIIYGMPQWMDFETIEFDFFENLNVHVSNAYFIDKDDPSVTAFNRLFYNRYGKSATKDAFLGYDTALMLGKMLKKYGTNWTTYMDSEPMEGLQSPFGFDPIKSNTAGTGSDNFNQRNKTENKKVFILKYENYQFSISN